MTPNAPPGRVCRAEWDRFARAGHEKEVTTARPMVAAVGQSLVKPSLYRMAVVIPTSMTPARTR